MNRRVLAFAASRVALEYEAGRAERLVGFLTRDAARDDPACDARVTFRLTAEEHAAFVLHRDGRWLLRSEDPGEVAELLQASVAYDLVDRCAEGLSMHAATLACEQGGLLLPAQSGSGKSTLSAWLVSRGFVHLTDELTHLPVTGRELFAWGRPIELKRGGRAVLEPLFGARHEGNWLETPSGCMLQPELLGAAPRAASAVLGAIVFPRYEAGAALRLSPLSSAEACARLLACCLNARNLAAHGLRLAGAWARQAPAFALSYGDLAGVEDALRACLSD